MAMVIAIVVVIVAGGSGKREARWVPWIYGVQKGLRVRKARFYLP